MILGIDASRAGKKEKTGTEWYSYYLLKAMSMLTSARDVRLYCKEAVSFDLPKKWEQRRIAWPFDFFWTQGGLSLEMVMHPPDVLFVPSHTIPLIHPRRTVTTIHDIGFHESPEYRSVKERNYLEWSTRYAVKHCTTIITISKFTKQELIRVYGADASHVEVVSLGIDADYGIQSGGEEEIQTALKKYGITQPYLLFVGRIDSRKNLERLVRAFEVVKKETSFSGELVLAGPLGYDCESILKNISQSACVHSIRTLGWISESDKKALLHGSEMFVFPSLYEGFGLPVIEAQSCGVPVMCSNTTSLPEIAGDGALFCDPQSHEDIAEKMIRLLTDKALRYELGKRGIENAQRYSWTRCARETLRILEHE